MCYNAELAGYNRVNPIPRNFTEYTDSFSHQDAASYLSKHNSYSLDNATMDEFIEVTKAILLVGTGYVSGYDIDAQGLSYSGNAYALYHSILSVWVIGPDGANNDGAVGWREGGRGHNDWSSWHSEAYYNNIRYLYSVARNIRDYVKNNYPNFLAGHDIWFLPTSYWNQGLMFLREAIATETVNFTPKVEPYSLTYGDDVLWLTTQSASIDEAKAQLKGFYENANKNYVGATSLDLNDVFPNAGNSITVGVIFDKTYTPAAKVNRNLPAVYMGNDTYNTVDGAKVSTTNTLHHSTTSGNTTISYYLPEVQVTISRGETKVVCETAGFKPRSHTYSTTNGVTTLTSVDNTVVSGTGCLTLSFSKSETTYNFTSTSSVSSGENAVTTANTNLTFTHQISPTSLGDNNAKYSTIITYADGVEINRTSAWGTSAGSTVTVPAPENSNGDPISGSVTVKQCAYFSPKSVTINDANGSVVSRDDSTGYSCATRTVVFNIPETTYHVKSTDTATIGGVNYTNGTYRETSYDSGKSLTISFSHSLSCEDNSKCLPYTSYTTRATSIDTSVSTKTLSADTDSNSVTVTIPTPGRKTVVCETVGYKPTAITLNSLGTFLSSNNQTGTGTVCVTVEGPPSIDTFIPDSKFQ